MLKFNEQQADALLDALGFGVIWWDDLMDPAIAARRQHCADLEEKIENKHVDFSSDDIKLMIDALILILENGEDLSVEHVIVKNMLLQGNNPTGLIFQYA